MSFALTKRPRDIDATGNEVTSDRWIEIDTPGGRVFAAFSELGISSWPRPRTPPSSSRASTSAPGASASRPGPRTTLRSSTPWCSGEDAVDLCDLDQVSPFTRRVLEAAAQIERGQTRSYQWLARQIGMPRAARAVGNALGSNPVPLAIPCHRIVRGDGIARRLRLRHAMKRRLLEHEGALGALASA